MVQRKDVIVPSVAQSMMEVTFLHQEMQFQGAQAAEAWFRRCVLFWRKRTARERSNSCDS